MLDNMMATKCATCWNDAFLQKRSHQTNPHPSMDPSENNATRTDWDCEVGMHGFHQTKKLFVSVLKTTPLQLGTDVEGHSILKSVRKWMRGDNGQVLHGCFPRTPCKVYAFNA